jgi:hypothetical protein
MLNNKLKWIPSELSLLLNLKRIYLDHNPIKFLCKINICNNQDFLRKSKQFNNLDCSCKCCTNNNFCPNIEIN